VFKKLPIGIAENFQLTYTDSANTVAIIKAKKNLDYTNLDFPYYEFPDGLNVIFFDEFKNKTQVFADYAIVYNETNLVDLRGNVVINTNDGMILKTEQLYWDTKLEWLFTQEFFNFNNKDYFIDGNILDANNSFEILRTGNVDGNVVIKEEL
tara:strand:+ start:444 stop:899 length:456 start_codon:yes stop_codon:yes gene_type:complete